MADKKIVNNAGAAVTTGIAAVATITNGAGALGSEIDAVDLAVSLQLLWTNNATPVAYMPVYVYALRCLDGTNYEDGGTAAQPLKEPLWTFAVPADNGAAHRQASPALRLPRGKFKFLVWNASGQQINTVTLIAKADNLKLTPAA